MFSLIEHGDRVLRVSSSPMIEPHRVMVESITYNYHIQIHTNTIHKNDLSSFECHNLMFHNCDRLNKSFQGFARIL